MINAARPALVFIAMSGPAVSQEGLADSWIVMVESCVRFAETGRRAVFDGWDIASVGGGVCQDNAACVDNDMTFIAPPPWGSGAVTVRVGLADWVGRRYFASDPAQSVVTSFPPHAFCASATEVRHETVDLGQAHGHWVREQRAAGRLFPAESFVSAEAGPYVGCGYDGRAFLIEFSLTRPGPAAARLNYPTRAQPAPETPMICAGVTS